MKHLDFINRVKKRFKQLSKWSKRRDITCFRVYNRDLPDYPLILDYYQGDYVLWFFPRTRDDSVDLEQEFQETVYQALLDSLDIEADFLHIKGRKIQKGLGQYQKLSRDSLIKHVSEGPINLALNFSDYLDVGLFLDHRKARSWVYNGARDLRVLNLYAYTGSFSCAAKLGGAKMCTSVDTNPNYINWIKQNFRLNDLAVYDDEFIISDCMDFLIRARKFNLNYDLIICDPPTFSNSKKSKTDFSICTDYVALLNRCIYILSKRGHILFSTNAKRFTLEKDRLDPSVQIQEISQEGVDEDFLARPAHQSWLLSKGDPDSFIRT